MPKYPPSIEPDSGEQKLFETLSYDKEDLESLSFIRRHMKFILDKETQHKQSILENYDKEQS